MEQQLKAADGAIEAKLAKAADDIRAARESAKAGIEAAAAELAQEIASKVAGLTVSSAQAGAAVKAAMNHG